MKNYLVLLAGLLISADAFSQSTLYQTSSQQALDYHLELFDKQLFSASLYDNSRLLNQNLNGEQQKSAELHRAMSALEIESPDGPGLMKSYILDHGNHPSVTTAGLYLGDHFFYKKNYREAIEGYNLVNANSLNEANKADVLFKQGYSYFQLKNYGAAAPFFDQAKVLNKPISADAYYYSGFIAVENGNNAKAIADLEAAGKSSFYATKVPYLLTALYYRQGNYDQAIQYAEPLLASGQNLDRKETINLYLAEAYYAKRDFANASKNYDAFINAKKGVLSREEVYKAGISFFEIKNYQRATDYLKVSASSTDEIGQSSSYYLGHAYLKLDNYQFATTSFQAASKSSFNKQIQEESLFNFAKTNLQRGTFSTAISALDEYLETYPSGKNRAEAETLLSEALINSSDYLRAIEQMDRIQNKSPRIQSAYQKVAYYQAMVYYRDQKYKQALALLDKSQSFPVDRDLLLETHFWKGEINAADGNLPQAIRSYEALRASNPASAHPYLIKTHYGLGYAYFNSQNYPKAEEQFRLYTEKLRGNSEKQYYDDALLRLGDSYYVQKKFADASATFQRAITESNSVMDYAFYRLAVVQNFQSQNNQALSNLDRLISGFSSSLYIEDALFLRGQIYLEEVRYSEASRAFTELISGRPNSPFIPYALESRAVANFSTQNYDQTIADYKAILDNHPNAENSETALKGLQETLALQGRSAEFGDYLARYKGANPGTGNVQSLEFEAAKSLYFDKNFIQAARAFENYLRSYPKSGQRADALYFAGDSYMQAGDQERGLGFFRQLEKEPSSPQRVRAMQKIGVIELERGNYAAAIPYLETAAQNARSKVEEAEAVQGLMIANFATRKYQQSITYAEKLMTLDGIIPESTPKALLTKAKAQREMNQKAQAEVTLQNLVNNHKTIQGAEGLYLLALSFQERSDFAKSNDSIFDFSSPFADYDYWYGKMFLLLADNYQKTGEDFQAKATLESIVQRSTNAEIKAEAQAKLRSLN
ncbi:tetratricopeptide repeat protein [Algoriphagus sp.]|jgi:tetratricopeptide (TPR) repeat protein|uniref:tetratricopeptide repeat protein n=1 Tax=Algoriphagus sp. TaxID=1872435 RepID=UPI002723D93B|nr:tetratricopeptide repeat protein [Algoriphagus sp.]MDO8968141.1 tetratricopeptide repeat protein [Algoriphagus sp.]MDP3202242.1 tetratricopeptide repeat protein [Algoriphagus sp.]